MRVPAHLRLDRQKPVISVFLDNTDDFILKQYHCNVCGKIAFEYYSDIRIIMAGDFHNPVRAPFVVQCNQRYYDDHGVRRKCKTIYNLA